MLHLRCIPGHGSAATLRPARLPVTANAGVVRRSHSFPPRARSATGPRLRELSLRRAEWSTGSSGDGEEQKQSRVEGLLVKVLEEVQRVGEGQTRLGEEVQLLSKQQKHTGEEVQRLGEGQMRLGEEVQRLGEGQTRLGEEVQLLSKQQKHTGEEVQRVGKELRRLTNLSGDTFGALVNVGAHDAVGARGSPRRPRAVTVCTVAGLAALLAPVLSKDRQENCVLLICELLAPQVRRFQLSCSIRVLTRQQPIAGVGARAIGSVQAAAVCSGCAPGDGNGSAQGARTCVCVQLTRLLAHVRRALRADACAGGAGPVFAACGLARLAAPDVPDAQIFPGGPAARALG